MLASGELDAAPTVRRILTRLHLLMCDNCSRYSRELRQLGATARQALRSPVDPDRLANLERAIRARVQSTGSSDTPADPD
jgi:hypothetical protein